MSYSRTFILILGTATPGKMEWFLCLFLIFTLTSGDAIGNNTCKGKKKEVPRTRNTVLFIYCSIITLFVMNITYCN